MANSPTHHNVGIRLERKFYERLLADATADRRTVSNLVNVILAAYYEGRQPAKKLNGHDHKATAAERP